MGKPILCLDFDGVCHSYTSGWKGADVIPDLPVPGLFEFLREAVEVFEVHIFSSRSIEPNGVRAMIKWFHGHYAEWHRETGGSFPVIDLQFPNYKPPSQVSIDDRAITFDGTWPEVEVLRTFKPWNKR